MSPFHPRLCPTLSEFPPYVLWLQMLREMQDEQRAMDNDPAEMQAQAHASAVKRFTGGGFAVN